MEEMQKIEGVKVYNKSATTGVVSFNIWDAHPHDVSTMFDEEHIALRAGHHCAQLITRWLEVPGTLRACVYIYNTLEDVDKFIEAVKKAAKYFEEW